MEPSAKPERSEAVLSERPQCLVIDGHPIVRLGVRRALQDSFEIEEATSRDEAVELVRDVGSFDVAIVDMRRWSGNDHPEPIGADRYDPGPAQVRARRSASSPTASAPSATWPAPPCRPAPAPTCRAPPAPSSCARAAEAALAQERFVDPAVPPRGSRGKLTKRQREILQLLANGESTTVAARELDLSEETIKTHTKNALARLGARNRTHAVAIALRESLIE